MKVDAKTFLDAFDTATSYKDVAAATGLTETAVKSRARAMRKRDVPLKEFPRAYGRDWDELKTYQAAKKIYGGNGKAKRGVAKRATKKTKRAKKGKK